MFEEMMNQIGQFTEAKTYTTGALVKSTLATGKINPSPILNSDHTRKGAKNDSSITFGTPSVFVTEVNPNQLTTDGDYYINYLTGEFSVIPGANAAGGVAITYYVNELMVYLYADIQIGAVEVKDGITDTRAKVGVGTAIVESDNALAVKDPAIGATTDAVVATDAAGTLSAKLRGVVKLLDVMEDWDDGTDHCQVDISTQTLSAVKVSKDATPNSATNPLSVAVGDGTNEADVIATINSLKTDLSSVKGTVTDVNSGNKSDGSQRVVVATDDVNMSAIKTAVEIMDDWDDGADHCQVDISTQTLDAIKVSRNATPNTNLNPIYTEVTASALPAGAATEATLADVKTSVQIMDDWDESDRAKVNVNLNSGIAVDIGAGNASTGTARVSVATDDVNMSAIKTAIEIVDNFISGSRGLVTEDNSASIKTAVEIMDDWDENDRAKVNPIAGQIGIAGGTGVDGATVPRVTLATNVGLPAGTNSLGKVTITPSAQATRYATSAYAASGVIKGSAGSFYGLFGYNSKVSDQYLQLHDAASLPADAAVPVAVIKIPAESTFSIDCETAGIAFTTGIVWCNSSTAPTKTIGSADVFLTALYL